MVISLPYLLQISINFFLYCIYFRSVNFLWALVQKSLFWDAFLFTRIFLLRCFLLFWKILQDIWLNRFNYFWIMNLLWNLFLDLLELLSLPITLLTRLLFVSFFYLFRFRWAFWLTFISWTIWVVQVLLSLTIESDLFLKS